MTQRVLKIPSFMEGSRLSASVGLYRDVQTATDIQDGDSKIHLHVGQRIMVDCVRTFYSNPASDRR